MDSGPHDDTRRRRRDADEALAGVRRELRRASAKAVAAAKAAARAWVLTPHMAKSSLLMYALADCSPAPAVKYLASCGRQRHWPGKAEDELRQLVEDLYLQVDVEDLVSMMDAVAPSDPDAMRTAQQYVLEWRLFTWVQSQNYVKGVAPSTSVVLDRLEATRVALPVASRPPSRGVVAQASARACARRWRRRWGGHIGKLKIQEPITLAEAKSKALSCHALVNLSIFQTLSSGARVLQPTARTAAVSMSRSVTVSYPKSCFKSVGLRYVFEVRNTEPKTGPHNSSFKRDPLITWPREISISRPPGGT